VALQFVALGALALAAVPGFVGASAPVAAWVLALAGALLGAWAVTANRPGNFNIHPAPREGGLLVRSGLYRWVRHPMYAALLLAGVGGVLGAAGAARWMGALAWLGLLAVLVAKAGLEERWLVAHHPGYAACLAGTRRFVPGLY
jgi:protein-S-isoprenylcysteine O-methyltransferase Ste14